MAGIPAWPEQRKQERVTAASLEKQAKTARTSHLCGHWDARTMDSRKERGRI